MLDPTIKETVNGQAEVRELFKVPKIGVVAGCYVSDGKVVRGSEVRLLRDSVVVYTGKVGSLRRFKDDVAEVQSGYECGIGIANYNDLKIADVIEFFSTEKIAAKSL
jgi:translation initiation factor IF-2